MLNIPFSKTSIQRGIFLFAAVILMSIPLTSGSVSLHKETRAKGIGPRSHTPEIRLNKKGLSFVKKYIRNSNECLVGVRKRSTIPFTIIDSVFTQYNLPVELKYLAVIESELKPSAKSQV